RCQRCARSSTPPPATRYPPTRRRRSRSRRCVRRVTTAMRRWPTPRRRRRTVWRPARSAIRKAVPWLCQRRTPAGTSRCNAEDGERGRGGNGVMTARCRIGILLCVLATMLAAARVSAIDLRAEPSILGQVRDGDGYFPGPTEVPVELYGDFGLSGLPHA